jgi:hypothetical protein
LFSQAVVFFGRKDAIADTPHHEVDTADMKKGYCVNEKKTTILHLRRSHNLLKLCNSLPLAQETNHTLSRFTHKSIQLHDEFVGIDK